MRAGQPCLCISRIAGQYIATTGTAVAESAHVCPRAERRRPEGGAQGSGTLARASGPGSHPW